jgi:hypothetical protein
MKSLNRSFASFFAALAVAAFVALAPTSAHAYSTCGSTTITKVFNEVVSGTTHTYVLTAAGVGFDITKGAADYDEVFGLAKLAAATAMTVTLNFSAGSVNCATYTYRTDLINFILLP